MLVCSCFSVEFSQNNAGRGSTMPVFVMGRLRVSRPTPAARPPQFGHNQDFTLWVKSQKAPLRPPDRSQGMGQRLSTLGVREHRAGN